MIQISGTNLVIEDLSELQTGSYTCRASHENEQQSASTFLDVLVAPKLEQSEYEGRKACLSWKTLQSTSISFFVAYGYAF